MKSRYQILLSLVIAVPVPALAATKVEPAVEQLLAEEPVARVIVVTRADPEKANGGASLTAPQTYVADALDVTQAEVKRLGAAPAVSVRVNAEQLERLRENPNVEAVLADIPVPPATDTTIGLIHADIVHQKGFVGTDRAVAVLDTGLDSTHSAFANAVAAEACFSTNDSQSTSLCPGGIDVSLLAGSARMCPSTVKGCDHGTHVGGIVAGRKVASGGKSYSGVSPGAKLVPIQVFSLFNNPKDCNGKAPCVLSYPSDQFRALDWVAKRHQDLKIAAVNMSLGGGYHDRACDNESALTDLIERLRAKGVITVIAAGNNRFYDGVSMPGCISSALTVGATTKAGAIDTNYSNGSAQVDIVAPGTMIVSAVYAGAYQAKTGTSMAAPHVAGAIALLRQQFPVASANEIEAKLKAGGPTVTDPRNGIDFARLDLARPDTPQSVVTGGVAAAGATDTDGRTQSADQQSFIIRSSSSAAQVTSSVASGCGAASCELKQIGADTWKVDVLPSAKLARDKVRITPFDMKNALNSLSPDTKVFANNPAAPLSAN